MWQLLPWTLLQQCSKTIAQNPLQRATGALGMVKALVVLHVNALLLPVVLGGQLGRHSHSSGRQARMQAAASTALLCNIWLDVFNGWCISTCT